VARTENEKTHSTGPQTIISGMSRRVFQ